MPRDIGSENSRFLEPYHCAANYTTKPIGSPQYKLLLRRVNIRIASWGKWRMKQPPFRLDFPYFRKYPCQSIHSDWSSCDTRQMVISHRSDQWASHRRPQQPIISQTTSSHRIHHLKLSSRLLGFFSKLGTFQHVTFQPQFPANSQVNLRKAWYIPPIFRLPPTSFEESQVDECGQMIPKGFPSTGHSINP